MCKSCRNRLTVGRGRDNIANLMKPAASGLRRVLIVDDDRDTREMYSESLSADGFDIMSASSGEEALRLSCKTQPTVVVTDLRLKGKMDGLELARRLRADRRTSGARIILLTGASWGGERQHAEAAGCDRFLLKPCLPNTLASEIRNLSSHGPAGGPVSTGASPSGRKPKREGRGKA
jgi:CheY-like chemotaxis protein